MASQRTVVVAGSTGVVGRAAALKLAADGYRVIGLARRPQPIPGVQTVAADLSQPADCVRAMNEVGGGVSQLVYAALYEKDNLVQGWSEQDHVDRNVAMFANLLDAVLASGDSLEHVVVLQGTKAYTGWMPQLPVPARERWPWRDSVNFYRPQQELLQQRQAGQSWTATYLRPQAVFGEAIGSNMNITPALGVYAALLRQAGEPLHFPGGAARVSQAVDAELLARAIAWSFDSPAARDETFNVTNGEAFSLKYCWPAIAAAFGMDVGEDRPLRVADDLPAREADWEQLVKRFELQVPATMLDFVGRSLQYLDLYSGVGVEGPVPPILVSTIKIRQAGFADCVDTEEMFSRQISRLRAARMLPPLTW
ncbi:MAG: NAD-dependent epimerase [Frankiales bacterium]|nr:NAD-dependent epimerase [Frankiales bacterium]